MTGEIGGEIAVMGLLSDLKVWSKVLIIKTHYLQDQYRLVVVLKSLTKIPFRHHMESMGHREMPESFIELLKYRPRNRRLIDHQL